MERIVIHLSKGDNRGKWKTTTTHLYNNIDGHMNVPDLVKTIDESINKGYTVEIRCNL